MCHAVGETHRSLRVRSRVGFGEGLAISYFSAIRVTDRIADFLQGLNKRHPVYAPFTTPVYSNAAFEILGYVLEKVTSQPYETVVQNTIFKPLGLSRSTVSKPRNTSQGVVPVGKSDWDFDLGGGSA